MQGEGEADVEYGGTLERIFLATETACVKALRCAGADTFPDAKKSPLTEE